MDAGYKGNVSEQNEETVGAEKINNLKDAVNEMEVAKTTSLSETQHGEETINWLSFLNFKDVANVFRLSPSKERDNKGATAKEDPSDTFKIKAERAEEPFLQSLFKKTSQKVENGPEIKKIISETSQQTKEDSSDAFKIKASSKEGDNKGTTEKEDSSDAFKIKAERTDEPFLQSLFRKTQKVEIKKIISETSEQTKEEMDAGYKGNVSEKNKETIGAEKINNLNEVEVTGTTDLSETQNSEETINHLSFLNFKDVSNIFRLGPSKERDHKGATAKADSPDTFKIKASSNAFRLSPSKERDNKGTTKKEDSSNSFKIKAERTDEPFLQSLFRKTSQKVESCPEIKKIISETSQQTKEDSSDAFKIKASSKERDNKGVTAKEDPSDTFKIKASSKEGDNKGATAKEDSSDAFKIKPERTDKPFLQSLFRKTSQKVESAPEIKKIISVTSQFAGFKGNVSEQNEETDDAEKLKNNLKDMMKELEVAETTSLSEAHHGEEMIPTSRAAEQRCETEESSESADDDRMNKEDAEQEEEEEEKPSETLPLQPLSSEIDLFSLRDQDDERGRPGGISWTVKSFACYLTFDPNTANSELRLSDSNRTVTREWTALWPPEHPDRFRRCPQVLCREGLLDSAYWEVEWRGGADIGVAYNDNCRDGDAARCLLGHNERSWSLECSEGSYAACHANRRFRAAVAAPEPFARRVGVHLDWSAGALSFYCISPDAMVHLHTFRDTFTEPLYPAFWVWAYDGAVSLSQVELGWERLLQ
ncbi:zinc-binding protein A33-like [Perca fluviatilis]|uniref:zinc-binding protein A33-like n=1 Tax=Perca fluviatilis TaxID=8168 RepID=UPI001963229B|nr:zinc-binding protein A33-like [Perca fluviatilis]